VGRRDIFWPGGKSCFSIGEGVDVEEGRNSFTCRGACTMMGEETQEEGPKILAGKGDCLTEGKKRILFEGIGKEIFSSSLFYRASGGG